MNDAPAGGDATLRLDKWLWHARIFRSRSLASKFCLEGRIRIGGRVVEKAHQMVKPGDVLTFAHGRDVKVLKIVALGKRRRPAAEARTLYEDLSGTPAASPGAGPTAPTREPGSGRPTKADRRALDRLRGGD